MTLQNQNSLKFIEDNYILLLIILLGAVLRIYDLDGESLWLDELYSIEISKNSLLGILKEIYADNDNHPPLYYLILHYWMKAFGDSALAVRFLSVIFGVLSIAAIYEVARRLFSKNTALLSALILATSAFYVKYSQDARGYSLMAFLSLLSIYFFLKLLDNRTKRAAAIYILTSLLLIYTHYYALLLILAQNIFFLTLYILMRDGNLLSFRRWLVCQVIIVVLYLPQLFFLTRVTALQEGYWLKAPNWKSIPGTILQYSGSWPLFILFSILSLFALISPGFIFRRRSLGGYVEYLYERSGISSLNYLQKLYLLILWLLVPIILPFLISVLITPVYHVRYTMASAGALFILVSKGAWNIGNKKLTLILAGLILILSLFSVSDYYREVHKHQWREAVLYLESQADEGDPVFVFPDYDIKSGNYYLKRGDLELIELSPESLTVLRKGDEFWVIISALSATDEDYLTNELLGNFSLESIEEFKKLKVYHYAK